MRLMRSLDLEQKSCVQVVELILYSFLSKPRPLWAEFFPPSFLSGDNGLLYKQKHEGNNEGSYQ